MQPFLINIIILFLKIDSNDYGIGKNSKSTPVGKPLLHKDLSGKPQKETWNCITAVGMLIYLQCNIHPELSMAVHQMARFCTKPKLLHKQASKRLGRYLLHKKTDGIIYNPDITKGLECYVGADFSGAWKKSTLSTPTTSCLDPEWSSL